MKYRYEITGRAAGGQTWTTAGVSRDLPPGAFKTVFDDAVRDTFRLLTEGKAVYGKPGLGCAGPYAFKRLLIEERE